MLVFQLKSSSASKNGFDGVPVFQVVFLTNSLALRHQSFVLPVFFSCFAYCSEAKVCILLQLLVWY